MGGQCGLVAGVFHRGCRPRVQRADNPAASPAALGGRAARVLDIGCGEGQLSRESARLPGVRFVAGIDPTAAQLAAARDRQHRPDADGRPGARGMSPVVYARASATSLPFPDGGFDAAFACLVFEHIDDVVAAVAEAGRVLAPDGTFLLFLNHPLLQAPGSGWVDDDILGEQYWRIGPTWPRTTPSRRWTKGFGSPSCTVRSRFM